MSEGNRTSVQEPTLNPTDAVPSANARFASRRRLIKAGALSAPVALTLVSQPVIAATCNTSSAWGSAQINPNASTTARNARNQQTLDAPRISDWKNVAATWTALGSQVNIVNVNDANYYKKLTFGSVFGGTLNLAGVSSSDAVWDKIVTNPSRDWATYMIVARLNYKINASARSCLTNNTHQDQLNTMTSGTYFPSNLGLAAPWDKNKIMDYLAGNGIVRP